MEPLEYRIKSLEAIEELPHATIEQISRLSDELLKDDLTNILLVMKHDSDKEKYHEMRFKKMDWHYEWQFKHDVISLDHRVKITYNNDKDQLVVIIQ